MGGGNKLRDRDIDLKLIKKSQKRKLSVREREKERDLKKNNSEEVSNMSEGKDILSERKKERKKERNVKFLIREEEIINYAHCSINQQYVEGAQKWKTFTW